MSPEPPPPEQAENWWNPSREPAGFGPHELALTVEGGGLEMRTGDGGQGAGVSVVDGGNVTWTLGAATGATGRNGQFFWLLADGTEVMRFNRNGHLFIHGRLVDLSKLLSPPLEEKLALALEENPRDMATRNALVDFLLEAGRMEEAERIRKG